MDVILPSQCGVEFWSFPLSDLLTRMIDHRSAHATIYLRHQIINQYAPKAYCCRVGSADRRGRGRLQDRRENHDQRSKEAPAEAPTSTKPAKKAKAKAEPEEPAVEEQDPRPRLTTPDLEFDYDRSQLRDPRPTPGRVARPRLEESDKELTEEWKSNYYIPQVPKPKGRLNAIQQDILHKQQALLDPSATFHDLYVCHKKGPSGSPTYDGAGFRLDWKKVDNSLRPRAYNKRTMINSMGRAVDKAEKDNREMNEIFFAGGKPPTHVEAHIYGHYMKDQVSKDLGVPFHQIEQKHFRDWEQKGFTKPEANNWWHEPNEEEKRRSSEDVMRW